MPRLRLRYLVVACLALTHAQSIVPPQLFWGGAFVAGARSYEGAAEWLSATMGLAAISATMLGATSRLERKEAARYAAVPGRAGYVASTGALTPRIKALRLPRLRKPAA